MKFSNDPIFPLESFQDVIDQLKENVQPLNENPTIPEFYAGKDIFITGGSGFIGKVLIEKLIRSCPDIKTIFVLMRLKKGKTIDERIKDLTRFSLFDVLRTFNPEFEQKLVAIPGDVSVLNLGLSPESVEKMKNVSIIFHSAATVKFDDTLKYAVLINTRGTREVMKFAESLTEIKLVMHVSTTYSNVYLSTVEEKIYPEAADWQKTIEICEKLGDDEVDILTQHFMDFIPNTYVFSKNLAEQVSYSFKDKLPVVVFRPLIVVGTMMEPFAGWVSFSHHRVFSLSDLRTSTG
jgi:alcohol-forming fatty acyl-CoA reductase